MKTKIVVILLILLVLTIIISITAFFFFPFSIEQSNRKFVDQNEDEAYTLYTKPSAQPFAFDDPNNPIKMIYNLRCALFNGELKRIRFKGYSFHSLGGGMSAGMDDFAWACITSKK